MVDIILARHGETDWNVAEVFRGRIDVELNETGMQQAGLLGKYLSSVKMGAVFSSPLKRALKTAEVITGYHALEVNIVDGLIDFDYGEWQGLSHQEVKERYQGLYSEWISRPEQVRMPNGESLEDVRQRATVVVHDIMERDYEGVVLLASHRVVNKVLICALLGLDNSHFWNVKLDTCGIASFTYDGEKFILTKLNDTSFLKSVPKAALTDF